MPTTQITIYADTLVYTQGATLTAEQRAELQAKADRFREIMGTKNLTCMNIPVRDPRTNALIGYLGYEL